METVEANDAGMRADLASRHLAGALRARRKALGWSLDRAAAETGVSKAMLGQIERGESSPTVATLWKIAGGLGMSLSSLLEPAAAAGTHPRRAAELRSRPAGEGMLVAPLFPFDARTGFEIFELTLLPAYERLSEPHVAGVEEYVLVVRGALEVLVEGSWVALGEGEALRFAGDRPHGYRNRGAAPAVFHNLIHYPAATR
ncbi:helix-turn-helix domain-containing protein [Pseudothauera nasutitermitis]|uniref:Helix-turn-helix domain-containing protein n=1 Tax=Pseudothauera nasutitermitis TaxID=2565930 RepID=A0A4S4B354_9RHOO|nr:helix-turn-helix domain-containing protein [Pseudothauera nasutitermitis]THF66985.1 helix-turn-helix domain-containing protein [Pseudothauera nasutitermitis]